MSNLQTSIMKELKPSEELLLKFDWSDKVAYAQWLNQTYYFVRHSTRLLCRASSRFDFSQNTLHHRFNDHTREEKSHEVLLERDLKQLGYSIDSFEELPETAAFYQRQYYLIDNQSPITLFGYILLLEVLAVTKGPALYAAASKAHGGSTSSFLKVHSQEDPDHVEKALQQMMDLPKREIENVIENLKASRDLYNLILTRILAYAKSPQKAA
ncbi:MAG: iron-containing redox enzyme family protein [Oligoflexia bacterium]|nr:iron-containing redox enzyme family protein [Oligoflexia bacterium]